ncbi:MAG TPA: porin family protein [Puia sp.]|nr:porin family protein [Puia sp.]
MKRVLILKTVLAFYLFFSCIATVKAQWEIGARGGISIPNLSAGGSQNNPLNTGYNSRLGPDFGVSGEYHFSTLFSLEARAEYSSQGGKKTGMQAFPTPDPVAGYLQSQGITPPTYLYADFKSEAKLNYLLIPVLAKFGWDLGAGSTWRLYAGAGPYVGFLLSAKQVLSGKSTVYFDASATQALPIGPQSFDSTQDLKSQLHSTNVGVDGVVGLSFAPGPGKKDKIFIEGGGNYGFINIQKGTANGKNNTGAGVVTIGYSHLFGDRRRS